MQGISSTQDAEYSLRTTPIASPPSVQSSTTSSTQRISSRQTFQKYDGKQDPTQWLRLYSTAVSVAGGDTNTKVLYFPMVLEPAPLTWLESLKPESIHSWDDLKKVFVDNFARIPASGGYSPLPCNVQVGAGQDPEVLRQALLRHKSHHPQRRRRRRHRLHPERHHRPVAIP